MYYTPNLKPILNTATPPLVRIELILNEIKEIALFLSTESKIIYTDLKDRLNELYRNNSVALNTYQRCHTFIIKADNGCEDYSEEEQLGFVHSGIECIASLLSSTTEIEFPEQLLEFLNNKSGVVLEPKLSYLKSVRATIISCGFEYFEFVIDTDDLTIIRVSKNNINRESVQQIKKIDRLIDKNIPVYLHDVELKSGEFYIGLIVLYPDYLIDVTSISECYQPKSNSVIRQFINLFQNKIASKSILIGTTANEFLDELILDSNQTYEQLLSKVFRKFNVQISALNDEDISEYYYQTSLHYKNIIEIVKSKFNNKVDKLENCLLEPSFYSVQYGIQGRLDVLVNDSSGQKKIIELKSGKPYNVNSEGINETHHAQTCLYNLLLESVYGHGKENEAWILYSSLNKDNLRKAIDQNSMRVKLMNIRNSIILIHLNLSLSSPENKTIFDFIKPEIFEDANLFTKRDGVEWLQTYSGLSEVEKSYIKYYSYFISRELMISKCGLYGNNQIHGLASMWLLSQSEKEKQYTLISNLRIYEHVKNIEDAPILKLLRESNASTITQFRIGDTLILYPQTHSGRGMLHNLVYKCTLIYNEGLHFSVRLRGRQFVEDSNNINLRWCLESDTMERTFLYQYSNLFEFASASKDYRELILGKRKPDSNWNPDNYNPNSEAIVEKVIASKDYFLLWGPPGSGKTSFFIKRLVEKLVYEKEEHILIMAYTNRAVDEICEVIEKIEEDIEYIRIGSRYGTRSNYQNKLLDYQASFWKSRDEVHKNISKTKIFIGTLASLQGKKELFSLKKFDTIVIDEASQILESSLIGFLSRFKRFIMVGDHLQLPSVSTQSEDTSRIFSTQLRELDFEKMSESLFERLLRKCKKNKWAHCIDMLHKQGRMHVELMKFPSKYFYQNALEVLNSEDSAKQMISLENRFPRSTKNIYLQVLRKQRTIFIYEDSTEQELSTKINLAEAQIVIKLIAELAELYKKNNLEWTINTCGIICPFRVQISAIKNLLEINGLDHIPLTIDTVERYQGSAREIIIISCCVKSAQQLDQISSLNQDSIDRKLNVALTRAKEQIIVVGNKKILRQSPIYNKLIEEYFELIWY